MKRNPISVGDTGRSGGTLTDRTLRHGLAALARADADFGRALAEAGPPPLRRREPGCGTLLRAIVAQQLSTKAAATIWSRFEAAVVPLEPGALRAFSDDDLRALGLSRQKVGYCRALAEDLLCGRVDLQRIAERDDEAAIAELMTLKGIGRWTAEIYLLFALGRPDVFPADDLALMAAAQRMKRLEARPTGKELREIAAAWRPWRGAAAHFLWHYYRFEPL